MKKIIGILLLGFTTIVYGQTNLISKFQKADSLIETNDLTEAYPILKNIEQQCNKKDTIYDYILWGYAYVVTQLEQENRMSEQFDSSLLYGLEALKLIGKGKSRFDREFAAKEYWMTKNIIVSYFGLGKIKKAEKHKKVLYKAYKAKKLPEGIDGYFNFSFFKWKDKNVWGYEWYPELPSDRFASSFTKIVYYVYSTNSDGSDNEQLFRFHVLMFHQNPKGAKFDYILERQMEKDGMRISGSYYKYLYKENIDYTKLKNDIIEILEKDIQPDSRRIIQTR